MGRFGCSCRCFLEERAAFAMKEDLEDMLPQAAGWTEKSQSRPGNPRWNSGGSGSDGYDDDAAPSYSRKKPPPQVLLKKRHQPEKGGRRGEGDEDDDDDDDSDSAPSVGSDLYKDEELEKMSELDREMILAERSSRINDYKLKQMAKRMRQQVQPEQVSTSHIEV
jgi:RNA polymerase-associated protein RTF1